MRLKNYPLTDGNHFIAMEYYRLILNRTFLILITEDRLIGLQVNGMVAVEGGGDPFLKILTDKYAILEDLQNPYAYMKSQYLSKLQNLDIYSSEILKVSRANFSINRQDIKSVFHDRSKKWGMGYYPHDGKVYVKTQNNKTKEFIILGAQSGAAIVEWIRGARQGLDYQ